MSQERLSMRKLQEVLRLKWESGLSHRAIARSCGISPATVSEYIQGAYAAGLSWPLPADLTEDQLWARLFPPTEPTRGRIIPVPGWAHLHAELRRKGVTLRLLWVEYREAHPDGYGYSQFCEHYRQWASHLQPTMRMSYVAGERLFVGYAGQTIPLVHPETGEVQAAQIFVAVLGASSSLGSLYDYGARFYSPYLNRWIQPDTIVPDPKNPQTLNRYTYANNNPVKYTDPSGHYVCTGSNKDWGEATCYDIINQWLADLQAHGGDVGAELVKKFWESDADWPIKIEFVDGLKTWGQTDTRFGKLIQIQNSADLANSTSYLFTGSANACQLFTDTG